LRHKRVTTKWRFCIPVKFSMAAGLCPYLLWVIRLQLTAKRKLDTKGNPSHYSISVGGKEYKDMGTSYAIGYAATNNTKYKTCLYAPPDPLLETGWQPVPSPPVQIGKLKVKSQPPWDKLLQDSPADKGNWGNAVWCGQG